MHSLLEFDYSRLSYFYLSIHLVISCWIVLLTLPYFISRLDIFHSGFWAFRDGPLDDLLEGLKNRLKTTVLSSKENGTVMVYNRAFRRWKQFGNDKLNGKAAPASPFHVVLYLHHLVEETHSPCAVDSAFYGLKWAHDVTGIPSPTDDPIVEAVGTASKIVLGTSGLSRKEPISATLFHDIINKSDLNNPVELRDVYVYVLFFAGFFWFDNVYRVRSDISFKEGFMVIKHLKSKSEKLRKGDEVVISQLSSSACPVELLKRYLAMFKIPPHSKDFIFKPISKGKGSCELVAPDKPISCSTIRGNFRRDLHSLGVEPFKFGLLSLRFGGATIVANNRVNDRVFQRPCHWKSL